jgi:hypothetical protein
MDQKASAIPAERARLDIDTRKSAIQGGSGFFPMVVMVGAVDREHASEHRSLFPLFPA